MSVEHTFRRLEPLRQGKTVDLVDEEQQFAYARTTDRETVIVLINNDTKEATFNFDYSVVKGVSKHVIMTDVLGNFGMVEFKDGKFRDKVGARPAVVFTVKNVN